MKRCTTPDVGVRGTHPKYGEVVLVARVSEYPAVWVVEDATYEDDELHLAKEQDFEEFYEYTE